MGVSKNNGTPKSSILIGFPIINHPFGDTPIFGHIHINMCLLLTWKISYHCPNRSLHGIQIPQSGEGEVGRENHAHLFEAVRALETWDFRLRKHRKKKTWQNPSNTCKKPCNIFHHTLIRFCGFTNGCWEFRVRNRFFGGRPELVAFIHDRLKPIHKWTPQTDHHKWTPLLPTGRR